MVRQSTRRALPASVWLLVLVGIGCSGSDGVVGEPTTANPESPFAPGASGDSQRASGVSVTPVNAKPSVSISIPRDTTTPTAQRPAAVAARSPIPTPGGHGTANLAQPDASLARDAISPSPPAPISERADVQREGVVVEEIRVEVDAPTQRRSARVARAYALTGAPAHTSCHLESNILGAYSNVDWPSHTFVRWGREGQTVVFGLGPAVYAVATDRRDLWNVVPPRVFSFGDPPWDWSDFVGTMVAFDVAPDGQRIAYSTCEDRPGGIERVDEPYVRDRPRSVDDVGESVSHGEPVIVVGKFADDYQYEIGVVNIDGTQAHRLTTDWHHANYPAWSPDGRRIAYVRVPFNGAPTRLMTTNADGTDERFVARLDWVASRPPAWSPGGQRIAFAGAASDSKLAVYSVAADGSDLRRLSNSVSPPSWSPDGSRLVFVRPDGDRLAAYTIAADGSDAQRVVTLPGWIPHPGEDISRSSPTQVWIPTVAWSPDGSRILIDEDTDGNEKSRIGLYVASVDGSDIVRLRVTSPNVWAFANAAWSPDGSRIAVIADLERKVRARGSYRPMVVLTMRADGTDVRVLATGSVGSGVQATGLRRTQPPADLAVCAAGVAAANPQHNPGLVQDCEALLTIQHSLGGIERLNWQGDRPMAKWTGVEIEGTPPRVRRLSLGGLDLPGAIPSAVGRLSDLRVLDLSDNRLTGGIPEELGSLASLQSLDLSANYLHGEIPHALGALHELELLDLAGNNLHGPIPTALTGLSNLHRLWLNYNLLSGTVPAELAELPKLRSLKLIGNQFSGCFPTALHSLIDDSNTQYLPPCESST